MYSMLPHIRIAALVLSYLILPDEYIYLVLPCVEFELVKKVLLSIVR